MISKSAPLHKSSRSPRLLAAAFVQRLRKKKFFFVVIRHRVTSIGQHDNKMDGSPTAPG